MRLVDIILIYLLTVNVVAAAVTIFDKRRAVRGGRRIRESTLLILAALGGSPAMLATMRLIRHKTRKKKFMLGIPVILALQLAAAFLIWRVTNA